MTQITPIALALPIHSGITVDDEEPSYIQNFLLKIAKHHKHANIILNLVNKHKLFNPANIDSYCLAELKRNHRLLGPILINSTLEDSELYLKVAGIEERSWNRNDEATFNVKHLYNILKDQQLYWEMVNEVLDELNYDGKREFACPENSHCGCIWKEQLEKYSSRLSHFQESNYDIWQYIVYSRYIEPTFRIILFIVGLVLNLVLFVMLSREKSMRTETNVLIFNLVANNFVILLIYIPIQYGYIYGIHRAIEVYDVVDLAVLVCSANALIVLCLNVKRYLDVSRILKPNINGIRLSASGRCFVYTGVIWTTSIIISLVFSSDDYQQYVVQKSLLYSFVYLVGLSIVVAVFSLMSSRKLQGAAQRESANPELKNITSSTVVLGLTVAYYSIHIPFFILVLSNIFVPHYAYRYYKDPKYPAVNFIINVYYMSYPCVSAAVLYKTSSAYRTFFRKYICRCWYVPDDGEYITMSSLQHAENED